MRDQDPYAGAVNHQAAPLPVAMSKTVSCPSSAAVTAFACTQ
jgi:hypothetical protein